MTCRKTNLAQRIRTFTEEPTIGFSHFSECGITVGTDGQQKWPININNINSAFLFRAFSWSLLKNNMGIGSSEPEGIHRRNRRQFTLPRQRHILTGNLELELLERNIRIWGLIIEVLGYLSLM